MKKVITMVGTSLFENYFDKHRNNALFRNYFESLKDKGAKRYEEEKDRISQIKKCINQWLSSKILPDASAEIKSLIKLKEALRDNLDIYLLASDTIVSRLAGEILEEILLELEKSNSSAIYLDVVEGLQVKNRDKFARLGMVSLIKKIFTLANEYWENIVFNITGGYKATLPYLTILAQVNKCPIYYVFEETDALINVPSIPLDIKWEIFEKYENFFAQIERENVTEIKGVKRKDYAEVNSLLERVGDLVCLNPLGFVLWEKYKQRYCIFHISEFVKKSMEGDANYRRIAEKSYIELKRRLDLNPQDPDLNHGISEVDLGKFKCFKHKEENSEVRILYKTGEKATKYENRENNIIYIGLLKIGREVHNVESEYIRDFKNNIKKIKNQKAYQMLKIEKTEVQHVS